MKNKLILHVGTHKTGTTSLQNYCRLNENRLASQGFYYPDYDLIGAKGHVAHHDIAHAIAGREGRFSSEQVIKFIEEIKKIEGTVFLSAEPFYRHLEDVPGSLWEKKEAFVDKVQALFGKETEICFVFRNQYDFAVSLYQELVKTDNYSQPFKSFLETKEEWFDYERNLSLWSKRFSRIHVLSYETLTENGVCESNFLKFFDINTEGFTPVARFNDSLPSELIEVKRLINQLPLGSRELLSIRNQMIDSLKLRNVDGIEIDCSKYDLVNRQTKKIFVDKYRVSNQKLIKEYPVLSSIIGFKDRGMHTFKPIKQPKLSSLLKYYLKLM